MFSPLTALIALAAAAVSFVFLLLISHYSAQNAPVEAQANRDMTGAILEYARGLAVVKSFGKSGASMEAVTKAIDDSKKIHIKVEWGYVPSNALHLLALKCGSVGLALTSCLMCLNGKMDFSVMLMFVFFSFVVFASLEPISDSAHTLSVIDDAMDQLDALRGEHLIDADGKDVRLEHFDIEFKDVDFGYDSRKILKQVSFRIPERTSTAIVGSSGSGKTTICSLIARFYDPQGGSIKIGGTLSGGEKQRISIARAMLKDAPIIILDEATASIDPENEHLIQSAISELTRGKTIITIAHRLATIQKADQILVVEDGRIAESGTHEELVAREGTYKHFMQIREKAEGWRIAGV